MKTLRYLLFALTCAAVLLAPALAEARAGGSYSRGGGASFSSQGSLGSRTWNYNGGQPVQRSLTPSEPSAAYGTPYAGSFAQRHPFLTSLGAVLFGSWLGSLLFPHWGMMGWGGGFGSLFSWLLIIFVVSMVFRAFRRGGGPLAAPHLGRMYDDPPGSRGFGFGGLGGAARGADIAISETDQHAFEAILKAVQGAWSKGDLRTLGQYATPEMLSYFSDELTGNQSEGVANRVEEVELINGDVREAWDEGDRHYATCRLHWRALDYTVRTDRQSGDRDWVVSGDPKHPSEAQELWTFVRRPGGHWLLSAIQQV